MCKPTDNITAKVEELMELRKMADELQAEMEAITDEIKAYMGDEETMMAGSWKVTYKETVSRRMDTTALKKDLGDALEGYQNPSRIRKELAEIKLLIDSIQSSKFHAEEAVKGLVEDGFDLLRDFGGGGRLPAADHRGLGQGGGRHQHEGNEKQGNQLFHLGYFLSLGVLCENVMTWDDQSSTIPLNRSINRPKRSGSLELCSTSQITFSISSRFCAFPFIYTVFSI